MHELAATESLLHTAIKAAEEGGAEKILKIQVGIGRYSGILQEYVRKYYEIAAKGTIAEKAERAASLHEVRNGADSRYP